MHKKNIFNSCQFLTNDGISWAERHVFSDFITILALIMTMWTLFKILVTVSSLENYYIFITFNKN